MIIGVFRPSDALEMRPGRPVAIYAEDGVDDDSLLDMCPHCQDTAAKLSQAEDDIDDLDTANRRLQRQLDEAKRQLDEARDEASTEISRLEDRLNDALARADRPPSSDTAREPVVCTCPGPTMTDTSCPQHGDSD